MTDDVRHQMVALLPRLRRFAFVLTRDMERADDLVQETCTRALGAIESWTPGTRLDSWLFRIAQNLWVDKIRSAKRRGEPADLDVAADIAGEDGRTVTEGRLALSDISAAIKRLPEDQQVLVALICIDGLSYKEASETLKIPIGTVMSRLARARQTLSAALNAEVPAANASEPESTRGRSSK